MKINYTIKEDTTLKEYLLSFYLGSKKIYKLISEKRITKGDIVLKENDKLLINDVITINYDEARDYKPVNKKIDIIYEDDYLLIINKEPNIIIHSLDEECLANYVSFYYKKNSINQKIKFAHRLDTETSGLIIFVKDDLTLAYFSHYLETHEIKREYQALVKGHINHEGFVDKPIGRNRHDAKKMIVSNSGKNAKTYYKPIKRIGDNTLISCILETGRTHQIRVHLSYIGHPLLGDKLYGENDNYQRCMLHSKKVEFYHPVLKKNMTIEAKLPKDFNEIINK